MNEKRIAGSIEKRHTATTLDGERQHALMHATQQHFAGFVGTPREAYDAMTAATPLAEGVLVEAVDAADLSGWWVRPAAAPADRALLFLHGGAYLLGSAAAYRGLVSQLAARASVNAFVLDYPLAPEHPFPAAPHATLAAVKRLQAQGIGQLALVGDSAGGALALGILGDGHLQSSSIASVVVFSPWLDLAFTGGSFLDPATHDPALQRELLIAAAAAYLAGADPKDGRASPLYALPHTLPPLAIQVGTEELLLDDARRYAALAAEKGGEVRLDVYEGMHHVFQRATVQLQAARSALDAAAAFLTAHWR